MKTFFNTVVAVGWFAAALTVCADEKLPTLKAGSEVYSNVTVWRVTATDLYFVHAQGMSNAKLKSLDPEMQRHFHFDPAKAENTEKNRIEANARYRAEAAAREGAAAKSPPMEDESRQEALEEGDMVVPKLHAKSFMGQPAPRFVVEKWLAGPPNPAGKFVLIDFWATWCRPCRESIPHLKALHAKFKDRLVIIGLSNETEAAVRKMTSPHIDYFVAIDTQERMKRAVEVRGIQHAMLIDPQGIVRFEGHPGYLQEKGLERLLAKYSN